MPKDKLERYERMDYLKGNEAFADYVNYWDNYDPKLKDKQLRQFVCKMPLTTDKRRALLNELNSPLK